MNQEAIPGSPLPALDSPIIEKLQLDKLPRGCDAYQRILHAEHHAKQERERAANRTKTREATGKIVRARVIGYFLLEFRAREDVFGDRPCLSLVDLVTTPSPSGRTDQDVVFDLGQLYCEKLIRSFRTSNSPYPEPAPHPTCPIFDASREEIMATMEASPQDHRISKRTSLARDKYQCMMSGLVNASSRDKYNEVTPVVDQGSVVRSTVEMAHILNGSVMKGIDPAEKSKNRRTRNKTYNAASVMALLNTILGSPNSITDSMTESGGINGLGNVLSLELGLHRKFDALEIWFEPTGEPHHYEVRAFEEEVTKYVHRMCGRLSQDDPITVDLSPKVEGLQPPDPRLPALHAVCARVARLSGA